MIEHMRVAAHKGFRGGDIAGLGKVTAICGQNSSGKSTILEALARPNGYSIGIPLDSRMADLKVLVLGAFNLGRGEQYWQNLAGRVADKVVANLPILFANSSGDLVQTLKAASKGVPDIQNRGMDPGVVEQLSRSWVPTPPRVALLPVKRRVDTEPAIQFGGGLHPSGEGLINDLFFRSAQAPGTDERLLYESIARSFESLTSGMRPILVPDRDNRLLLHFSRGDDQPIPAKDCGQGLTELLLILRYALGPEAGLVLIEEPELHLHADLQRRLLVFLQEVPDKQFILATHSNVFLSPSLTDRILLTQFEAHVKIADKTNRAEALAAMGYSLADNLASDAILLTEGPYDGEAYRVLLHNAHLTPETTFRTWGLGGDNMDKFDLSTIAEHYKVFAIVDGDKKSLKIRRRFERKCKALGIPCHILKRGSIEHYFPTRAIRQLFPKLPQEVPEFLDEDRSAADQVEWSLKKSLRKLAELTPLEDYRGSDLYTALKQLQKRFDA